MSATAFSGMDRSWYRELHGFPARSLRWEAADSADTASNKADYGLEDLQNLNVKDRFSVFERNNDDDQDKGLTSVEVKRSQSILNKMKKFQERGQARDGADSASGDESGSEASGDEQRPARDPHVVRSTRKTKKERPMSFSGLGDVKSRFEGGGGRREPAQDEAKDELAKMRGMICGAREHKLAYEEALREQEALAESRRSVEDPSLVVQGNLRASYERAVQEAGSPRSAAPARDSDAASGRRAADLASRFERGQPCPMEEDGEERQDGLKENGASHIAGSSSADSAVDNSLSFNGDPDVAREDASLNEPDEVTQEPAPADPELLHSDTTKRMLSKFKQMEQSTGKQDEAKENEVKSVQERVQAFMGLQGKKSKVAPKPVKQNKKPPELELNTHREKAHGNARQILSKFRQMEEDAQKEDLPDGPRPLKSFTPPPEEPAASDSEDGAEDSAEEQEDPDIVRASHKVPDEFLNKRTDQARSLRDRFESWEPRPERDDKFIVEDDCKPSLEITRNLRAKFESMKEQPKPVEKPQHRASRFIMEPSQAAETCGACSKRVYAMERLEVDKRILHKNCFRCSKCNCVLRMDTYTFNAGKLFCTPHFKQMFKTKGNYDEGFGLESRTKHWSNGHADHAGHNGDASAAKRPDDALPETNGRDPERHVSNGDDHEPEPEPGQEQEREQESEEERFDAVVAETEPDVFQKVYESVVADGI